MRLRLLLLAILPTAFASAQNPAQTPAPSKPTAISCPVQPQLQPDTPDAALVHAALHEGRLEDAVAAAQKSVTADPTSAPALTLLGEALDRDGQISEAVQAFGKALQIDKCNARAHLGAARYYQMTAALALAHRDAAVAHQIAPADPEITLTWIETLTPELRSAALKAFLAGPTVPDRPRLTAMLALLDQSKTCTIAPFTDARLLMSPLKPNAIHTRDWGLQVRINDKKTELLELDSTVSGLVLTRSLAARLGLSTVTPGDPLTTFADSIKIGNLEYKNCPVRVVDDVLLDKKNSLIGTEFFRDHLINIDWIAKYITLKPYPVDPALPAGATPDRYIAPEQKTWSRAYFTGSRILLPTIVNKKASFLFMLDTANVQTVIKPALGHTVMKTTSIQSEELTGSSTDILKIYKSYDTTVRGAVITGIDGKPLPLSAAYGVEKYIFATTEAQDSNTLSLDISPLSRSAGIEISGVIGFNLLKNYTLDLDYRDGLVHFVYDINQVYNERENRDAH